MHQLVQLLQEDCACSPRSCLPDAMPGAAPEGPAQAPDKAPLTAEQFSAWKQQRDAKAEQVLLCFCQPVAHRKLRGRAKLRACLCAAWALCAGWLSPYCSICWRLCRSGALCAPEQLPPVQERAAAAAQRKADILAGHVAPNGAQCDSVSACKAAWPLWNHDACGERCRAGAV